MDSPRAHDRRMDCGDLELLVERLYACASCSPTEAVPPGRLVRALLGEGRVIVVHAGALRGDGALVRVMGEDRIYIRSRLSPERKRWAVAHELAEWSLAREGYREPDVEETANYLAGAIIAPRRRFLHALRERGERFSDLAHDLIVTESCAALRFGETTGIPLALIAHTVRVRGELFGWPSEAQVRALATGALPRGLRRSRLRDELGRVVIRAA